jgi:RNA polymerase-binding transcription factor DksA
MSEQERPSSFHEVAVSLQAKSVEGRVEEIRQALRRDSDPKNGSIDCIRCLEPIGEARRKNLPGTKLCGDCAAKLDPMESRVPSYLLEMKRQRAAN